MQDSSDFSASELALVETIRQLRQADGNGPYTFRLARLIERSSKPLGSLTLDEFIEMIDQAKGHDNGIPWE